MKTQVEATARDAVLVEDATEIRVMGQPILEALPSRAAPYEQVDPFILVHEGRMRLSALAGVDTKHPHRGFDNLWYVLEGSVSTGHSTGPDGAMERAGLSEGALLALRTGRGAWHAEAIGADELEEGQGADTEFRSVLFWVNLARKDKQMDPSAQVLPPEQMPVRQEGAWRLLLLLDPATNEAYLSKIPTGTSGGHHGQRRSSPGTGRSS